MKQQLSKRRVRISGQLTVNNDYTRDAVKRVGRLLSAEIDYAALVILPCTFFFIMAFFIQVSPSGTFSSALSGEHADSHSSGWGDVVLGLLCPRDAGVQRARRSGEVGARCWLGSRCCWVLV